MITKCVQWAAMLVIGLLLSGCYTDYGPIADEPEPIRPQATMGSVLVPGDTLKVVVYGEEGLTGSYTINPAGDLVMPLIGTIRAAGQTRIGLEHELVRRYAGGKFLVEPKIIVDVTSYRPIYVAGEALRPGAYPYSSGLDVLSAITLAGGPTYRASRTEVLIKHAGDTVWQQYPLTGAVTVAPGDLIRLPERYF